MLFRDQIYHRNECATFLRTAEQFGGLSNMAGGYPLLINDITIFTSEALYQACRFPHRSELQKIVIEQKSPMTSKMKSKPHRKESREDWEEVRVKIMWWCLRVKLVQHWEKFGNLLLSTGTMPIVEESYRDQFWGAKPTTPEILVGANVLGRLLTHLREQLKGSKAERLQTVFPPDFPQFLLMGEPIGIMRVKNYRSPLYSAYPDAQASGKMHLSPEAQALTDDNENLMQRDISAYAAKQFNSSYIENQLLVQLSFDY